MKRIGDHSLAAAIGQLDASRKARDRGGPGNSQGGPRETNGAPGVVRSLERTRAALKAADAAQLETLAKKAGMPSDAAARLADGLRATTPNEWTFVMISPAQNAAVVEWLSQNSKRPQVAVRLWARLFEVMRNDTGEIMKGREELAQRLGIEPRNLSQIMTELASINAIRRERSGRGVRYFMSPNIATHIPGAAARKEARDTHGPLLKIMDGGKD